MPKDKITDMTQPNWHAEVSWRRKPDGDDRGTAEGHVQLATVNLLSPFEFPENDTGGHFEAGERFDGWRVTLDETGIDRLIKALHKAKRQAFGSPTFATGGLISRELGDLIDGEPVPSRLPQLLAEAADADRLPNAETPETWTPGAPTRLAPTDPS